MNCGRKARKKSAVFGLSTFTTAPRMNARRSGSRGRLDGEALVAAEQRAHAEIDEVRSAGVLDHAEGDRRGHDRVPRAPLPQPRRARAYRGGRRPRTRGRRDGPARRSARRCRARPGLGSPGEPAPPAQKSQREEESGMTTGTILARAALPRHDVRLSDERSRQRADQGDARGARPWRDDRAESGGRARLQHVHDPGEARHEVRCPPRAGGRAEAARSRTR